jgi:hypothetical protein
MVSRLQPTLNCHRLQPVVKGGQDDTEPAQVVPIDCGPPAEAGGKTKKSAEAD